MFGSLEVKAFYTTLWRWSVSETQERCREAGF